MSDLKEQIAEVLETKRAYQGRYNFFIRPEKHIELAQAILDIDDIKEALDLLEKKREEDAEAAAAIKAQSDLCERCGHPRSDHWLEADGSCVKDWGLDGPNQVKGCPCGAFDGPEIDQ